MLRQGTSKLRTPWGYNTTGTRAGFTPRPRFIWLHVRGARALRRVASTSSLQASLLAAQAAATAFGSLRLVERATIATAVIAATAVKVASAALLAEAIRWWPPEVAPLTRSPRAVFSDIEPQFAATYFASVKLLDRLGGVLFSRKPHEGKAPWAAAFAVFWNVNVNDFADFSEELTKLFVCRAKVEVPYEYLT